jgi:hypothetical protein
VVAAAVVLALGGCSSGGDDGGLFVLLTDNQLLRTADDGDVLSRTRLAPDPGTASYGGLLAASPDRRTVYALVRGDRQHVAAIDRDGAVLDRWALPDRATWRRLAVGPRTARVYLAGNVRGVRRNELGQVELGARLLVLSPDGEPLAHGPIRAAAGRDWYVQSLTVAADESSMLVSYHGSDTTGADIVRPDPVRGCSDTTPRWGACLARNHGRAEWIDDGILAATGEPALAVLAPSGRVVRKLDTGLQHVHLMEFVVARDVAYAFGNCVQGAGIARVPLAPGAAPARISDACGDTAALLDDATLVLGRRRSEDVPGAAVGPALEFVDLEAGTTDRSIPLPQDPADVLAAG